MSWSCPTCGATSAPRETPAGTYCTGPCRSKLETCCEGAPLPEDTAVLARLVERNPEQYRGPDPR